MKAAEKAVRKFASLIPEGVKKRLKALMERIKGMIRE